MSELRNCGFETRESIACLRSPAGSDGVMHPEYQARTPDEHHRRRESQDPATCSPSRRVHRSDKRR